MTILIPTKYPSGQPSFTTTRFVETPTKGPTNHPLIQPSISPTYYPTSHPSLQPSFNPTHAPTESTSTIVYVLDPPVSDIADICDEIEQQIEDSLTQGTMVEVNCEENQLTIIHNFLQNF